MQSPLSATKITLVLEQRLQHMSQHMPIPQLPTSEVVISSFTGTNSTNTEVDNNLTPLQSDLSQFQVISSWADDAIEETKTRSSSPLTINNDIRNVNLEAEQAKLIELCRDLDNCECTPKAIA
ncbi:14699_t:CDS:2 [Acaulospora colombiana]|uniref:14699_t:CDS:1 n=1 Tax=Acaulospora colombiana TaxID=27376 RepID=A0ACA9LNX5_9GLOM|nr:14699_t:CDS:2 [Acaulospora colombiana]